MNRRRRYHHRDPEEEEFETPALREVAEREAAAGQAGVSDDSEDELQSESGLGESPEEDLMEDAGQVDDDDSDSDSSPEDVRTDMHGAEPKKIQSILDDVRKSKDEKKSQRKKKEDLFKMQKQDKLAMLKKRKLQEDSLEQLAASSHKKHKSGGKKQLKEGEEDFDSADEVDQEKEEEEEETDDDNFDVSAALGHFIPLSDEENGTKVKVISLDAEKRKGVPMSGNVGDFKKSMLYGNRHKRITSQQAKLIKAKRKARR